MAETVKKSRIVSDNDDNLEEALMEEFNMRLKKCMSQDDLQQNQEILDQQQQQQQQQQHDYDDVETIKSSVISQDFIRAEQENYYEEPKGGSRHNGYHCQDIEEEKNLSIYENVGHQTDKTDSSIVVNRTDQYIDMTIKSPDDDDDDVRTRPNVDDEQSSALYEDVENDRTNQPDLTLTDLCDVKETQDVELKSAKDRMLLSTDMAPCLLFTQTVTSPMLTPSEENIDFLKGFRQESNGKSEQEITVTDDDVTAPSVEEAGGDWVDPVVVVDDENIYENSEFLKKQHKDDDVIYENLKEGVVRENIYENLKDLEVEKESEKYNEEVIYQNVEELREETKVDDEVLAVDTIDEAIAVGDDIAVKNDNEVENDVDVKDDDVEEPNDDEKSEKMMLIDKFESEESTQVTQSYVETTTVESHGLSEKGLKKKKSKKSRKEEKENISVNGTNTICEQETFPNVNVKNLCRSFGDLTKIEDDTMSSCDDRRSFVNNAERTKSSFSKFDALQKKNVLHVRSSDSSKAQEKFNGAQVDSSNCRACGKAVFQMELIKAEKAIWHKNCFRCKECNKQLNVDTYQSNEGTLYCKPHFKALFAPKAVEDDTPPSDKPDLGLEELQSLNVKERFQVFEHHQTEASEDRTLSTVNVKRSPSILSKLAKFQAKGMDIGVADDSLNGIPIEESSSEEEEEEEDDIEGEDADLIRAKRVQKEKPFHFTGMLDVKNKWEQGEQLSSRDERREERKQEIQSIRNRLFMGKQGKMKEAYQQAVMESESCIKQKKEQPIEVCDTKSLKERFEKGEVIKQQNNKEREGEEEVFESEISKKSRSLFLELDANASKPPQLTPLSTPKVDVKKAREAPTPDRDVYRDPAVVRSEEIVEDSVIAKEAHTATKMLNKFRQMEENLSKEPQPAGPKPLKRFTPPPEPARPESSSEAETESEEETDEDEPDRGKYQDEDLIEAQKAARAKQLRAKFERWEANEMKREQNNSTINIIEEIGDEQSQIESTKTLRARFESMRESNTDTNRTPRVKVNRFVDISNLTETCESCNSKVYPLEKISVHNHIYHKNCFKCMECNCILRMDSYSYNQGLLYCIPHFKRIFISKGNYDTAFGLDQRKEKWNATVA